MPHQVSKAANKAAINVAESVEKLIEEATKREIVCIERAFATCRTIGRGDLLLHVGHVHDLVTVTVSILLLKNCVTYIRALSSICLDRIIKNFSSLA